MKSLKLKPRAGGVIVALWWRHGGVMVASWWRHGGVMVALVCAPKPTRLFNMSFGIPLFGTPACYLGMPNVVFWNTVIRNSVIRNSVIRKSVIRDSGGIPKCTL